MFENPSTSTNLLKGLEVLLQNDAIWDQHSPPQGLLCPRIYILPKRKAQNKIVKNEVTLKPSIAKSERKKKYQLPYSYIWFFGV
jgi:hypothetical protein